MTLKPFKGHFPTYIFYVFIQIRRLFNKSDQIILDDSIGVCPRFDLLGEVALGLDDDLTQDFTYGCGRFCNISTLSM